MQEPAEMRKKLGTVSCSFCLAKWLQVTVHLQIGHTHSCHHPGTHKIPLSEVAVNPSALHNTNYKKLQRKAMLEGQRPSECDYCWRIEDLPNEQISDRYLKSNDDWAAPHFDEVKEMPWDANVKPTYLEVSFSSDCNFKCMYCFPHISTSWEREIEKHGPYKLTGDYNSLVHLKNIDSLPIRESTNPYVDAFWKWVPEIYPTLKHFRVTGGEPLLSESTFKFMDYVRDHPNPKLNMSINSNLGVPTVRVQRFIDAAKDVKDIASLSLFTSLDTWGPQAEYIRTGLKLPLFEKHFMMLLEELPGLQLTIMCTFNALSVENFGELLNKVRGWKKLAAARGARVTLDISYLRYPSFLAIEILPKSWLPKFEALLKLVESMSDVDMTSEHTKLSRVVDYFASLAERDPRNLADFSLYIEESDRRRKTNFSDICPTYIDVFNESVALRPKAP